MSESVSIPHPLPEALVELIAQRFRVIGEPMRIRVLDALRDGPLTINELTEALGASQQNVSKHVGVLAQAGIVGREKDGNRVRCFDRRRIDLRAVRAGLRRSAPAGRRARPAPRGRCGVSAVCSTRRRGWPLERVLFALAGTVTL